MDSNTPIKAETRSEETAERKMEAYFLSLARAAERPYGGNAPREGQVSFELTEEPVNLLETLASNTIGY